MNLDEIRAFRRFTRFLEREVERQLGNPTACCGVTMPQCHVLLELEEQGGISLTDLAFRLDLDKSTLSRTVDSLVKSGLLSRVDNSSDRRLINISLTLKGKEKADYINRENDAYYRELLEGLTEEEGKLVLSGAKILYRRMVAMKSTGAGDRSSCAC